MKFHTKHPKIRIMKTLDLFNLIKYELAIEAKDEVESIIQRFSSQKIDKTDIAEAIGESKSILSKAIWKENDKEYLSSLGIEKRMRILFRLKQLNNKLNKDPKFLSESIKKGFSLDENEKHIEGYEIYKELILETNNLIESILLGCKPKKITEKELAFLIEENASKLSKLKSNKYSLKQFSIEKRVIILYKLKFFIKQLENNRIKILMRIDDLQNQSAEVLESSIELRLKSIEEKLDLIFQNNFTKIENTIKDLSKLLRDNDFQLKQFSEETEKKLSELEKLLKIISNDENKDDERIALVLPLYLSDAIKSIKEEIKVFSPNEKNSNAEISQSHQLIAQGGAIGGLIMGAIMILSPLIGGYSNLKSDKILQISPFIIFSFTATGWMIGFLINKTLERTNSSGGYKTMSFENIMLFIICFFSSTFFRGFKARDSYFVAGYENGNGLLGEPNFEVLATSLAISIGAVVIVEQIVKINRAIIWSEIIMISVKTTLVSSFCFVLVYLIYFFLIQFGLIEKGDFIISTAVFKFSFSHPERVIFTAIFAFVLTLTILGFSTLQFRMENRKSFS